MRRIFIANWKMNPQTAAAARILFRAIVKKTASSDASILVAAPFPFLAILPQSRRVMAGAQDVFWEKSGAYTGEVSPTMLVDVGAEFTLIGHSERRALGETDAMTNRKVRAALTSGLRAVLCVGEAERNAENFQHRIRTQLLEGFEGISKKNVPRLIVAYEPVWAIGTGNPVEPRDLFEMTTYIRRIVVELFGKSGREVPVLYGGSVNASNAADFLRVTGVSGLLIGGASLDPDEFAAIVKSV